MFCEGLRPEFEKTVEAEADADTECSAFPLVGLPLGWLLRLLATFLGAIKHAG